MDIVFTANFKKAGNQIGSTTGLLDDTYIQEEMNNLADYFRTSKLALSSLNVSDWDVVDIIANGQTYTYSR
jgi:hypothetical protein